MSDINDTMNRECMREQSNDMRAELTRLRARVVELEGERDHYRAAWSAPHDGGRTPRISTLVQAWRAVPVDTRTDVLRYMRPV